MCSTASHAHKVKLIVAVMPTQTPTVNVLQTKKNSLNITVPYFIADVCVHIANYNRKRENIVQFSEIQTFTIPLTQY